MSNNLIFISIFIFIFLLSNLSNLNGFSVENPLCICTKPEDHSTRCLDPGFPPGTWVYRPRDICRDQPTEKLCKTAVEHVVGFASPNMCTWTGPTSTDIHISKNLSINNICNK